MITAEGQLFQARYHHNHEFAQHVSIHANALSDKEACEECLRISRHRESRRTAKLRKDTLNVEIAAYRIEAMATLAVDTQSIKRQLITNMAPPRARLTLNEATDIVASDGLDALKLLGVGEGGDAWLCQLTEAPFDLRVAKIMHTPAEADKEYQISRNVHHPATLSPIS